MATLLPMAEQQFFDNNGDPLAMGLVYMYVPTTTTFKNTWQDSGGTILNTNPIILDATGRAIIYGSGIYRQVVMAADGDLIWDQITTSTAEVTVENILYYATSVGGAPNAIVVSAISPSDFSLTAGKTLKFVAPFTNTGSTTLNPLTLGSIVIKRVTASAGTVDLAGSELISGGVYDVLFNGTNFILMNPTAVDQPGAILPYGGATAPAGYLLPFGQSVLRADYPGLFAAIGTTWGSVDGTHFTLPDLRGRSVFGKDNMGGSAASRITTAGSGIDGVTLAAAGGSQLIATHQHTVPDHTHATTAPNIGNVSGISGANFQANNGVASFVTGGVSGGAFATTGNTLSTSSGTANMPPAAIVNYLIRC